MLGTSGIHWLLHGEGCSNFDLAEFCVQSYLPVDSLSIAGRAQS